MDSLKKVAENNLYLAIQEFIDDGDIAARTGYKINCLADEYELGDSKWGENRYINRIKNLRDLSQRELRAYKWFANEMLKPTCKDLYEKGIRHFSCILKHSEGHYTSFEIYSIAICGSKLDGDTVLLSHEDCLMLKMWIETLIHDRTLFRESVCSVYGTLTIKLDASYVYVDKCDLSFVEINHTDNLVNALVRHTKPEIINA